MHAGFGHADHIIERSYKTEQTHQGYIEPHACVASVSSDGTAELWVCTQGHFVYRQSAGGDTVEFNVDVTCMNVYGNRAKIGGIVTRSTDPTIDAGSYGWFQVFDNGEGANAVPDQSSLVGFGNEAANEAFCNSPNLPRFGPWDVQGNVQVRAG